VATPKSIAGTTSKFTHKILYQILSLENAPNNCKIIGTFSKHPLSQGWYYLQIATLHPIADIS
jgi:hypothetical protein